VAQNRPPASDALYERIETLIAEGVFKDGERLDEVRLAGDFGVSRTPLREALRLLSSTGLVELIPNRGAFVRQPSFTRLVEMFEVMAEVEAWCARLAAGRITKAQVAHPQILAAFEAVEEWMKAQGLEYDGPCREIYFADWDAAGPEDPVCDVAFPVK